MCLCCVCDCQGGELTFILPLLLLVAFSDAAAAPVFADAAAAPVFADAATSAVSTAAAAAAAAAKERA